MKTQRNILYAVLISVVISCFISYLLIANNLKSTFFYDTSMGVFSGAILAFFIALIEYFVEKTKVLEQYYISFIELCETVEKIKVDSNAEEYIQWYHEYKQKLVRLSDVWARIGFIIDFLGYKKYLKDILDYFTDFELLVQDHFRLLELISSGKKRDILKQDISKLIFETKKIETATDCDMYKYNRLVDSLDIHRLNIYNIYLGKCHRFLYFDLFLFTDEEFKILSREEEKCVHKIVKKSKKTGSTSNVINANKNILEKLLKNNFINEYHLATNNSDGEEQYEVSASFILFEYFDIKKRKRFHDNKGYSKYLLNLFGIMIGICSLIKYLLLLIYKLQGKETTTGNCYGIYIFLLAIWVIFAFVFDKIWYKCNISIIKCINKLGYFFAYFSVFLYFFTEILFENLAIGYLLFIYLFLLVVAICQSYIYIKKELSIKHDA